MGKEIMAFIFQMDVSEITMVFLAAQIIGLLTTVVAVISAQCKNMTMILVLELVANLLVALSYILLGGFSGSYVCLIACVQTGISYVYAKKSKKMSNWLTVIFIVAYIVASLAAYRRPADVLSGIAAVTFALAVAQSKAAGYRVFMSTNSLLWIIYDLVIGAFTMIITHGLLLVSLIIAMIRYHDGAALKKAVQNLKLHHTK